LPEAGTNNWDITLSRFMASHLTKLTDFVATPLIPIEHLNKRL